MKADEREDSTAAEVSNGARLIGVMVTLGSAAIAVFGLGSARGWWEGRSCALAACGADDIAWAWYLVSVGALAVTVLLAIWTWQMVRDPSRGAQTPPGEERR